jgi:arylformamidase
MADLDLEAEYDNRKRVPEHVGLQAEWTKASEAYAKEAKAELDLAYGSGPRQRYDLFAARTGGNAAPVVVFIHGGYWQRGDRKLYGFLGKEMNARGVTLALPSYSLCPSVGIMDIVAELRQCIAAIWKKTGQRCVVTGHSAGGHLAAALLATDWSKVAGVPADVVKAAYSLSGAFDLMPLVSTSLNEALRLDAAKAREASPILWPAPQRDRTFVAAAGGDESQEFIRQSLEIAAAWSKASVKAECVIVPGTNHFTIVSELGNPESAMFARVVAMAKA